jgi:uncharacterized membrane protein YeaQ/YmgE (transglycosylase-associated protein family)
MGESMIHIIATLIIGAIAGWLAGLLVRGSGFGLIVDIVVGVIGGFIGGWLASLLHVDALIGAAASDGSGGIGGFIVELILAVIGAAILLFAIRLVKKAF